MLLVIKLANGFPLKFKVILIFDISLIRYS